MRDLIYFSRFYALIIFNLVLIHFFLLTLVWASRRKHYSVLISVSRSNQMRTRSNYFQIKLRLLK
jgi:hypothetical protein